MIEKYKNSSLNHPNSKMIMQLLNQDGEAAKYVGGCVRDALLKLETLDIDIATKHEPQEVIKILSTKEIKVVAPGLKHGTITAIIDDLTFEITTLRRDKSTDGRYAEVEYTNDWLIDAERRDFTINAIYMSQDGEIFDPFSGAEHLKKRVINFIGDTNERINEDHLRILRFFRFSSNYGNAISKKTLNIVKKHKDKITTLSPERIQKEFFKILSSNNSFKTIVEMKKIGLLDIIYSGVVVTDSLERMINIDEENFFDVDTFLRFFILMPKAHNLSSNLELFRFSNKDNNRIDTLLKNKNQVKSYLSVKEVRKSLYLFGSNNFIDLIRISWAEDKKISNSTHWRALLAMASSWEIPALPIKARDVMLSGVPEGPTVGEILDELEKWWIDSDFIDDKLSLIERMRSIVRAKI